MPVVQTQRMEELPEESAYHLDGFFELVENNIDWDEENQEYTGSFVVSRFGSGELTEIDHEVIQNAIMDKELVRISDALVHDTEQVIIEFAHKEINEYLSTLSEQHEFHGVLGVKEVVDLKMALKLS